MIWDALRSWVHDTAGAWARQQGLETLPAFALEEPPPGIEADAACNLALLLAKPLKSSPRAIAQSLQKVFSADSTLAAEVTIAGAGFLNFRLRPEAWQAEVSEILQQKEEYGRRKQNARTRILIEFVSANPTGPLHVGHGRGAALGDSLAKILAHLGYVVTREYYINDAGNQIQLLGESLVARCLELQGKPFELPAEGYHGDYMKDLAQDYVATHPGRTPDAESATLFALERLLKKIELDLLDFGIRFDHWFSEARLVQRGLVQKYVDRLRERGHVEDAEEAVWFIAPDSKPGEERDKNRVLKRRDGRWTYFATDIAYHADKYDRGYEKMIDIWGADHHGYVARVKGAMQALGDDPDKLHILLYQLVSLTRGGAPVSMSKRSGEFVTLREVLAEVGRDACRFFFALRGPNTAMEFDLELAKKQSNENPVYYLQYAHARICSIFRQAAEARTGGPADGGMGEVNWSLLKEKEELELMKRLSLFPKSLEACAQEDSPHLLATYLLALGRQFHFFYDHHRVLGVEPELSRARLALLEAVRQTLRIGLALLGVSAPESM